MVLLTAEVQLVVVVTEIAGCRPAVQDQFMADESMPLMHLVNSRPHQ